MQTSASETKSCSGDEQLGLAISAVLQHVMHLPSDPSRYHEAKGLLAEEPQISEH